VASHSNSEHRQREDLEMRHLNATPDATSLHARLSTQSSPFHASPGSAGTAYTGSHPDLDVVCTSSSYTSAFLDPGAGTPPFHRATYGASNERVWNNGNPSHPKKSARDRSLVAVDQSSALIGRSSRDLPISSSPSADLRVRHELMAKAAEGRHRERIDFAEGHMDCE